MMLNIHKFFYWCFPPRLHSLYYTQQCVLKYIGAGKVKVTKKQKQSQCKKLEKSVFSLVDEFKVKIWKPIQNLKKNDGSHKMS